jgi:hypothetical protein
MYGGGMMKNLIDGFLSGLAAIATIVICGIPAWFTFQAIQAEIAPTWVYAPLGALVVVAILMTTAFIGKAARGVSPSRERRR